MINILKIFSLPKIRRRPLGSAPRKWLQICLYFHSTPFIIKYLMHMDNQLSCGLCGQVSKTAKKLLQGLQVRSFGIILHLVWCFGNSPCLVYGCLLLRTSVYFIYWSLHEFLCSAKFFFWGGDLEFLGGKRSPRRA